MSLHKSYQNGPGGKWNARIKWFETDTTIRLNMLTPEREWNETFPVADRVHVQTRWDWFKREYPIPVKPK